MSGQSWFFVMILHHLILDHSCMNDIKVLRTPDFLRGAVHSKSSNQPVGTLIYRDISPLAKPKV